MSAAKMKMGSEGFALLTRVFVALKRSGRLVDIVWFQESREYAHVVLDLVEATDDNDGRTAATRLREILEASGFLAIRRPGVPRPAALDDAPPLLDEPVIEDGSMADKAFSKRYTTTLR